MCSSMFYNLLQRYTVIVLIGILLSFGIALLIGYAGGLPAKLLLLELELPADLFELPIRWQTGD